jgi:sugar-specific transcriptional regulator TrmB
MEIYRTVSFEEMRWMRQEMLLKALESLGLERVEAEIYLLLAREGPQLGKSIARSLELYKQQLYRSLKHLQTKGMVSSTLERPALFSAVSFEKVLDILIEAKKAQALALQESKKELLSVWLSTIKKNSENS